MKYKVIALSVGAKSNKIFSSGDVVGEEAFVEGRAKELVEQGFLEEIEELPIEPFVDPPAEADPLVIVEPEIEEVKATKAPKTTKPKK